MAVYIGVSGREIRRDSSGTGVRLLVQPVLTGPCLSWATINPRPEGSSSILGQIRGNFMRESQPVFRQGAADALKDSHCAGPPA